MKIFSSLSVRTKLTIVVAGIPTLALIIVCAGFLINNVSMLREAKYSQLKTQAEILAFNCSAALQLKQREECKALLEPVVSQPTVELVGLYSSDDNEFLVVAGDSHFKLEVPELQSETAVDFTQDGFLDVWFPIRDAGGVIGAVALKANTNDLKQQMRNSVWSALWLATMTLLTCGLISLVSIRGVLEPILKLASVAKRITLSEDYSARVKAVTQDEVGELYESFNRLLDRVETTQGDLREASEAKSRFLANTSHEIRTPLNAIMGFVELLQKTGDQITPAERADYLETIRGSSRHLLTLINDILDLSKIEAGQMVYESIRFSPDQVISEVFSVMRAKIEEKSLRLEYDWATPIPATILSDESRFRQLLFNLVGNAVKFTTVGHVTLTARLLRSEELLEFEVADTGIGIPQDKLTALFQPFVQADSSVTRRFGGTGLGLAICKHISEGLGGTIRVNSELGKGSSFIVTLKTGDLSDVEFTNTVGEQSTITRPARIERLPDKLPNCRI
ncbi:MAG: HAMP domain-containing protein, partial [Planctomycetaceae bacterium]|nr:HAMP domain-containing protein [Planctomycetaceae bacterium]